ncbi:MAG: hypothetical protein WAW37_08770 [Syntrophobacteraceae bacterium]|jgi:hypothetical protein
MNPFLLPILLLLLSIAFYVGENVAERPNVFRAVVYVVAAVESFLYMTVVLG